MICNQLLPLRNHRIEAGGGGLMCLMMSEKGRIEDCGRRRRRRDGELARWLAIGRSIDVEARGDRGRGGPRRDQGGVFTILLGASQNYQ